MPTIDDLKQAYIAATGTYPPRLDSYTGPVTDQDILNVQQTAGGTTPTTTPATTTPTSTTQVTAADVRALFDQAGVDPAKHADGTAVDPVARIEGIVAQINSGQRTLQSVATDIQRFYFGQTPGGKVTFDQVMTLFTNAGVDPSKHADGTPVDPTVRIQSIVDQINAGTRTLESVLADIQRFYFGAASGLAGTQTLLPGLVPGKPAIWKNTSTGQNFLVYDFLESGVPMLYEISTPDLQALFGEGKPIIYDLSASGPQINAMGALHFGMAEDLRNPDQDPARAFMEQIEAQAAVRPWLREDDMLQLIAEAILEDRPVSAAEFQQTNWWQTHNEAQRQWLLIREADPMEANRITSTNEAIVRQRLQEAGVNNAPSTLVSAMASQFTQGNWDQVYLENQILAVSDPKSGIPIDQALQQSTINTLDRTRAKEQEVTDLVTRWLGPVYGNWDQSLVAEWAGRLRNDPDATLELTDMLKAQRLAMFPTYQNENLTYEDIAQPWKNFWTLSWGEVAPENDPLFQRVVAMNDMVEAGQLLREEGLNRNVGTVRQDLLSNLAEAVGSSVRRSF